MRLATTPAWTIWRERPAVAETASGRDYAWKLVLRRDGRCDHDVAVEWEAGGIATRSRHAARFAVAKFLDDDVPPLLVVVDQDGNAYPA